MLAGILYVGQVANFQRGGCKGNEPQPLKRPVERNTKVKGQSDLADRKRAQREHLQRRRAAKKRRLTGGR